MRQHHLPATLIAEFAHEQKSPRRNSKVWVRRRDSEHIFPGAAGGLTTENYVYDFYEPLLRKIFRTDLENDWQSYESKLAEVVSKIRSPPDPEFGMTVREILGTLIPHLAASLVRGWEFTRARAPLSADITRDNANLARVTEWQRTSARLLNWSFYIVRPALESSRFILNDLGYSLLRFAGSTTGTTPGIVFPLAPDLVLLALHQEGGGFYFIGPDGNVRFRIDKVPAPGSWVADINRALAFTAWQEVYAADKATLSSLFFAEHRQEPQTSPLWTILKNALGPQEISFWQSEVMRLDLAHLILIPDM